MILWLNPVAGLSGDMMLAALIDLGAPIAAITDAIASTGLQGWQIDVVATSRQGLRACAVDVRTDAQVGVRPADDLIAMVGRAVPTQVAAMATRAITALATVEAQIHGVPLADVHLHELGGIDTVVDVVGVAAGLHALGVTELWSAPLRLGAGQSDSAHGLLPLPAPATLALLRGAPVVGIDTTTETVTPTGASLLLAAGCQYGPMPALTISAVGYGAGSRDTPGRPNVLAAVLGQRLATGTLDSAGGEEHLVLLETTVDDVTGEVLGQLVERLLEAGAADAWLAPVIGKKGRPAHVVTALCREAPLAAVEGALLRETGSLGARRTSVIRRALPREVSQVVTGGEPVRVKSGPYRAKAEYEDLLMLARKSGRTLREVADRAVADIEGR